MLYTDRNRPPNVDWVPEDQLGQTRLELAVMGISMRVVGEISWQRQLARMENNPE